MGFRPSIGGNVPARDHLHGFSKEKPGNFPLSGNVNARWLYRMSTIADKSPVGPPSRDPLFVPSSGCQKAPAHRPGQSDGGAEYKGPLAG